MLMIAVGIVMMGGLPLVAVIARPDIKTSFPLAMPLAVAFDFMVMLSVGAFLYMQTLTPAMTPPVPTVSSHPAP